MEALKIVMPAVERKPCVCGATVSVSRTASKGQLAEAWLCSRHCGARGLTYEGALRRKIRLDLLSWGRPAPQRPSACRGARRLAGPQPVAGQRAMSG